ncbi:DUF3298 and DUF4163 domain-containing protein [Mucilaginibacter flavus]|uniref:DUF3298 and DUF4163 domain-containing protein n=1 Tax=Mucilaginibacter flavus TaxID=931504 RepID=UPI0025B2AB11|nr:DUF3298 and DUF4163 domain-containing protein [Mucilaginibacter flavus]MDN3583030.1 DUF3298 domain-containing protein [Mucilaginibacter flavus]
MKIIGRLLIIGVALSATSCNWNGSGQKDDGTVKDTLTYTYKTVHERAADCGNKPDSACTVPNIKYPVFTGQQKLNDTVARKLTSLFAMDGKADTNVEQMSKNFLKAYADAKKSDPRLGMFYELNSYAKILMQDSSITTLEIGGYNYTGGAHGASITTFINWNTKANKSITLNDLFTAGYAGKLKIIAESIFRKEEKLSDTASLARDYFFKDNKFALNDNFLITPIGLKFIYNQYEIKPYAAGQTELFIPYTQLKSLLQPNSVVAKFAK